MTRWARFGGKKRCQESTSWNELKSSLKHSQYKKKSDAIKQSSDNNCIIPKEKGYSVKSRNHNSNKGLVKIFHKEKYKWISKEHVDKIEEEYPGLTSKELFKMVAKDDKRKFSICWACQQHGHQLEDCPLSQNNSAFQGNHCYRCGDKFHKSSECSKIVDAGKEYSFAKCFKCNQIGHIISQCPQTNGGLYPHGGGCLRCGSSEHFQRDCTQLKKQKYVKDEEILLDIIKDIRSVEDETIVIETKKTVSKRTVKIVNF